MSLIDHYKTSVRKYRRRARSLEDKQEQLYARSPDVKRWVAYQQAQKEVADSLNYAERALGAAVANDE